MMGSPDFSGLLLAAAMALPVGLVAAALGIYLGCRITGCAHPSWPQIGLLMAAQIAITCAIVYAFSRFATSDGALDAAGGPMFAALMTTMIVVSAVIRRMLSTTMPHAIAIWWIETTIGAATFFVATLLLLFTVGS